MSLNFATREIQSQPIVGIRATTTMEEIKQVIGALFGEIMEYFTRNGLAPAGMPLTIYHEMDADRLEMECGMPVASPVEGTERVRPGELPAGKVATVTHMGPYEQLGQTWSALMKWMEEEDLQAAGAPWEVYVTDPGEEPDQSKWRTDIFFPIR
ncbi:MAG: GyrI-like domain-containing protein [Gemmatimonadota bacterium]|nr:GyrI-like domain-containing protein [Gemmatimonadota bacterium]